MAGCQDLAAARTFVEGLESGVPPSHPDVAEAWGGGSDGKECHKAALYKLTELDPSVPTISFHITDQGPHFRRYGDISEARAEVAYLQAKGLDSQVSLNNGCTPQDGKYHAPAARKQTAAALWR